MPPPKRQPTKSRPATKRGVTAGEPDVGRQTLSEASRQLLKKALEQALQEHYGRRPPEARAGWTVELLEDGLVVRSDLEEDELEGVRFSRSHGGRIAEHPPQLGPALRAARKEARVSLENLAEGTSTALGYLSRVERGQQLPAKHRLVEWLDELGLERQASQDLVDLRDVAELVDRFGLGHGPALVAVLLNRHETTPDKLREAIEKLPAEDRDALLKAMSST